MNDLNLTLPISLAKISSIIDRVAILYPSIPKSDIVLIIKSFFEVIRELLVQGKKVSINKLFVHAHIYRSYNIYNLLKIKANTPRSMK